MSEDAQFPPPRHVDWKKVKATFAVALAVLVVADAVGAFVLWGSSGAMVSVAALLCLALGFWITERLIAVFTRTSTANPTAIVLLLFGKLLWWGALFYGARHLPAGMDKPVALGIGAFLIALLIAMLRHYGMPRISDGNPPSAP
jgi:hypothetical protein